MEVRIGEQIITWALSGVSALNHLDLARSGQLTHSRPSANGSRVPLCLAEHSAAREGHETKLKDPCSTTYEEFSKKRETTDTHYTGGQGSRVFYYRHREIANV